MRKSAVLIAAAVTAVTSLAIASSASAIKAVSPEKNPEVRLDMSYSPAKKSTAKKQTGVKIAMDVTTDPGDGGPPPIAKVSEFLFASGMTFNYKSFDKCSVASLETRQPEKCKTSKVGTGLAVVTVFNPATRKLLSPQTTKLCAKITLFNGGGGKLFANIVTKVGDPANAALGCIAPSIPANSVLKGQITKASGGEFGQKLVLPLEQPEVIPGQSIGIDRFTVDVGASTKAKVKGKKVTVPYIAAPKTCTSTGWGFGYFTSGLPGGLSRQATGLQPCK